VQGVLVDVPAVGGMSVDHATKVLKDAGFGVTLGGSDYSAYPVGTVAYSLPGSQAGSGSQITLITSAGAAPAPPVHHHTGGHHGGGGPIHRPGPPRH
jgi:beta-lactam-binding protein with PASTA domain